MKKIMLATDFSERSDRALRRATLLARRFDASLSLVHVVDDDQPSSIVDSERRAASALLRDLQTTVQTVDGLSCSTRVVLADPFAGIAQATEDDATDLLVIGPHRRQALRDVFIGTTAERTIRSVACPVLMANGPPVGDYARVLLTTDMSAGAERAARVCTSLGLLRGASITILHVFDAPAIHLAMSPTVAADERQTYLDDQQKEASRALSAFVRSANLQPARQEVRQMRNSPAEEILAVARDVSAELVVIGTHGRSGLARFVLGSVTEAVLREATLDVLAVPNSGGP